MFIALNIFGFAVFIIVICVYIAFASLFLNTQINAETTLLGIFGDTIGGILNPILTFITFVSVLIGLWFQNQELKSTREELARAATAHESSLEGLKTQISNNLINTFENTFFSLLNIHNQLLNELKDRPFMDSIQLRRTEQFSILENILQIINGSASLEEANYIIWGDSNDLEKYLRNFLNILRFINKNYPKSSSEQDDLDKKTIYANIIKSTIDQDTLYMLAIAFSEHDENSFIYRYRQIIEQFSMLEYLKPSGQSFISEIINFYSPNAFGNENFIDFSEHKFL